MPNPPKRILVLQHTEQEHLGAISLVLKNAGVGYESIRCDRGELIPRTPEGYHGLIVLGGPQGVYEETQFPFLRKEKTLVREAIDRSVPIFGVCLGSQIVAEALGSKVYPSGIFEVGWRPVTIAPEVGEDPVLQGLPPDLMVLHWHGDIFELPEGAKPVGKSNLTEVQGFSWRGKVYGLVFHLEMTLTQLKRMVVDFESDLKRGGVTGDNILAQAPDYLAVTHELCGTVFGRWSQLL
jgi:GMP synthase-like glutamine amidotransferase